MALKYSLEGPDGVQRANTAVYSIYCKDSEGDLRACAPIQAWKVRVLNPDNQEIDMSPPERKGVGHIQFSFTPRKSGQWCICVTCNDKPLFTSHMTVKPGNRPQQTINGANRLITKFGLSGNGLAGGYVSQEADIYIQARDESGKQTLISKADLVVRIKTPIGNTIEAAITGRADPGYNFVAKYRVPDDGQYLVSILYEGRSVIEPKMVTFGLGADSIRSSIIWTRKKTVKAGSTFFFGIAAKDINGIKLERGGDNFSLSVKGPPSSFTQEINDKEDGSYTVAMMLPTPNAKYSIHVHLNGTSIQNSPLVLTTV